MCTNTGSTSKDTAKREMIAMIWHMANTATKQDHHSSVVLSHGMRQRKCRS